MQGFDFSRVNIDKVNSVCVSAGDLYKIIAEFLEKFSPWTNLLFVDGSMTWTIMAYAEDRAREAVMRDSVSPRPPAETMMFRALGLKKQDFQLAALSLAYRASALIRLFAEHLHCKSLCLRESPIDTTGEKLVETIENPAFLHAACLTPIEIIGERPGFALKVFTEKLRLARELRS